MPGAGSSAGSTRRRPRGTARWRRRQDRAPPPLPGRSAHRDAGGQGRERARARGRPAESRSEVPPEDGSAGAWGRGRSLGPRPQTFPPRPSSTPNQALRPPQPSLRLPASLPTFEFEVCGRVEDQDLLVLRHGPRGGRHRRDSAERGRARGGGGLLAGWGRWRRRLSRALRWGQLTAPAPRRLPL